jgi:16S rRNA (guanine527-N7)-methyltransferase
MQYECITLRAVDRMDKAVEAAARLVASGGWLALMTTQGDLVRLQSRAGTGFSWRSPIPLPGGDERLLALGRLRVSSPV